MSNKQPGGLMKFIRENPIKSFVAIALLAVTIYLIVFFVNKNKSSDLAPGSAAQEQPVVTPQLTVTGEQTVNPINTVSEYTYEFALGDFIGDNIDFTINIDTKAGFEESSITQLIIYRFDHTGKQITSKPISGIKNYKNYNTTFQGSEIRSDAFSSEGGSNKFVIKTLKSGQAQDQAVEIANTTVNVSKSDLNYTLTNVKKVPFTFNIGSATGIRFNDPNISRSGYKFDIDPVNTYVIEPQGNDSFKFRNALNGSYLTADGITTFKIDSFAGKYRLYSGSKMMTRGNGSGGLILKDPSLMNAAEGGAALMGITGVALSPTTSPTTSPIGLPSYTIPTQPTQPTQSVNCSLADRDSCEMGQVPGCSWDMGWDECVPS